MLGRDLVVAPRFCILEDAAEMLPQLDDLRMHVPRSLVLSTRGENLLFCAGELVSQASSDLEEPLREVLALDGLFFEDELLRLVDELGERVGSGHGGFS